MTLTLNITIPDSKVARSKERFLAIRPNDQVDDNDNLLFSDKEWIEEVIKIYLRKIDKKGKRRIEEQSINDNDTDMFEE